MCAVLCGVEHGPCTPPQSMAPTPAVEGSTPRKSDFAKSEGKRGKPSPTHFAHINTNRPTIRGGTLGRLVLGKSLTCDPTLGMRLGGSDKRKFDIPNISMVQKNQSLGANWPHATGGSRSPPSPSPSPTHTDPKLPLDQPHIQTPTR